MVTENKLPMPVICECGFSTMDAKEAVRHIKEKHPEIWAEANEDREIADNMRDYWKHLSCGADR